VSARATCPICLRLITVTERRELRGHNRKASYRKGQEPERCPGSGRQPFVQTMMDVDAESFGDWVRGLPK
jgi:hypothetical protein